jgi:hypothetical protein
MTNYKLEFITAQLRSEHPEWPNARVFETAVAQAGHQKSFGRDPEDSSTKVVAIATDVSFTKGPPKKAGMHPSMISEMSKHFALQEQKKKWELQKHVSRMAAIRKLMTERGLSFDDAFIQVTQGEATEEPASASLVAQKTVVKASGPAVGTDEWMWENVWT